MKRLIPGLFAVGLVSIPLQAKAHVVNDYYGGIQGRATLRSPLYCEPASVASRARRASFGPRDSRRPFLHGHDVVVWRRTEAV